MDPLGFHKLIQELWMVTILVIVLLGVLEVRPRTIHKLGQEDISKDTDRQSRNAHKQEKLVFSSLTLLEHILKRNLKVRMIPRNKNISSDVIKNREKIISHNVNKRSPGCLMWCLRKRILHPAQCHSYCRFSGWTFRGGKIFGTIGWTKFWGVWLGQS